MPDGDGVVDVPDVVSGGSISNSSEGRAVPDGTDKFHAMIEQNMATLSQTGVVAQNNFVTVSKAQDLDYLEGKRLVSLEEAIGVREVSSKSVPAGPTVT